MDKELSNAFGWLASNYNRWSHSSSEAADKLKYFFNKSAPEPEEQTLWAINHRQEIIDLYLSSK